MPKQGRRNDSDKLNYLFGSKAVTSNAPFGTQHTPDLKLKIVGGKPELVAEDGAPRRAVEEEVPKSKVPPLNIKPKATTPKLGSITEKPNNFDPTPFVTNKKGLQGYVSAQQDTHSSHIHTPNAATPVVPEEAERPKVTNGTSGQAEYSGKFTQANEAELILRLKEELQGFDSKKLKDAYLELTGFDKNLTGYVDYDQLSFALLRNQVTVTPRTIHLLYSKFKSTTEEEKVNYEQLLSFIGYVLVGPPKKPTRTAEEAPPDWVDTPDRSEGDNANKPTYYFNPVTHETEDYSPRSKKFPFQDRSNAKLLRYIEQQLLEAGSDLDFERIWSVFRQGDRERRGRLSAAQIKDLTYRCRIPLQESIVEQIIHRCESSNGQYNWQEYLEFIERVAPLHTGLKIPESKQPAEYARQYPTPSTDWPKRGDRPYKDAVTKNQPPEKKLEEMDRDLDEMLIRQKQAALRAEIEKLEEQLTPREPPPSEPWFERFMKLASALYDADKKSVGHIPREEATWLVKKNNTALHLHLKEEDVDEAIANSLDGDGKFVELDPLLKILGVKDK